MDETALLERARAGDDAAFAELVAPYRSELHAHCYRLLASPHDADDALQDALVGAWRGIGGFEGRSSVRSWLYRIATHAAYRVGAKRPVRQLSLDAGPACTDPHELGEARDGPVWVEPYVADPERSDPASTYLVRKDVELAFVAALQRLPASQRAVLLLREVLGFSAAEVGAMLDLSVPAVNSALQRSRATLATRGPRPEGTRSNGDAAERLLVRGLVAAWEARDVDAFVGLLTDDVRLSMPPLPAWFDGAAAVRGFLEERMFATPWRLRITEANGQPALWCWQAGATGYHPGGLTVLAIRDGRVAALTCFLEPLVEHLFPDISAQTDESGAAGVS